MTEEPKSYTTDIDLWWNTVGSYIMGVERDEILEYVNSIIKYVDAFMLFPVIKFEDHVIAAKCRRNSGDFNEVVEFLKELRDENEKVFLYMIYKTSDTSDKALYIVRYATIEKV